jgi:hypothetical protein
MINTSIPSSKKGFQQLAKTKLASFLNQRRTQHNQNQIQKQRNMVNHQLPLLPNLPIFPTQREVEILLSKLEKRQTPKIRSKIIRLHKQKVNKVPLYHHWTNQTW